MEELVQINVMVQDRVYPLRVREEEKEDVMKAVKLVNDKVREYQRLYDGKDKQDYLSMVLLLFAVEHTRNQQVPIIDSDALAQRLSTLERIFSVS